MSNRVELVAPRSQPTIFYRVDLAAPRELVFEAYTRPEQLRRWLGPRRLVMTDCAYDLRPGGKWHFTHRDEQGREFRFHGEYREVKRPELLVRTSVFEPENHEMLERVEFFDIGGQTVVNTYAVFPSVWVRNAFLDGGMEQGNEESFERLDELLARETRPEDVAEAQW